MLSKWGYFSLNFYKNYTIILNMKQNLKLFSRFVMSIFKYFHTTIFFTKKINNHVCPSLRKINFL